MATRLLSSAVEGYINHISVPGRMAGNSIKAMTGTLRTFVAVVGNVQLGQITRWHIDRFIEHHSRKGAQASSINSYLNRVRTFFKWCVANRLLGEFDNPMSDHRALREEPTEKVIIPPEKFADVLDAAANPRNRMIVALGLYLFVRQSEIRLIDMNDVSLRQQHVNIYVQKSRRRDRMPIPSELDTELRQWLGYYSKQHQPSPRNPLVCGYSPPRFNYADDGERTVGGKGRLVPEHRLKEVTPMAKQAILDAGFPDEHVGVHTLRRSGARAYFDALAARGYDRALRRVQAMLHHKNTEMTEHYLGLSIETHERDRDLAGQPMFASALSIPGDNVVDISVRRAEAVNG